MIKAVVVDLDGVIRHFDPDEVSRLETDHDLPPGTLNGIAFDPGLLDQVITGRITRAMWIAELGDRIRNQEIAAAWGAQTSTVDYEMLALLDRLRAHDLTTAILTNGTDTIAAELAESGIATHVDHIFNSAEIGYRKPDPEVFQHVLGALGLPADEVFFTDDSPDKLAGATVLGIRTHLFNGIDGLIAALSEAVDDRLQPIVEDGPKTLP